MKFYLSDDKMLEIDLCIARKIIEIFIKSLDDFLKIF